MVDHPHTPDGLKPQQLAQLEEHVRRGQLVDPELLLQSAYAHLEDVQGQSREQPGVNVALAERICHVLDRLIAEWDAFRLSNSRGCAASSVFFEEHDLRHDFDRRFADDLDILNACLRYVHRAQWQLHAEE